jgi:hypothetical protein
MILAYGVTTEPQEALVVSLAPMLRPHLKPRQSKSKEESNG